MPRSLVFAGKTAGLALAVVAGASLAVGLRAEQPTNPLRPGPSLPTLRVSPVPSDQPVSWRTVASDIDQVPALPAVDSPGLSSTGLGSTGLGQPELLPGPGEGGRLPMEHFGDPDLYEGSPWQQQVHPMFAHPWFAHGDTNDPHRHIGLGQPLIGTSWRNRPLYFGTFVGGILLNDIVPNQIYQNDTAFVGFRVGYDFDHFWGLETRGAFARASLVDVSSGQPLPASRDNFADMDLLFYPFGDARWRPYLLGGVGFQTFRFNNQLGQRVSEAPVDIPLGFGVKYFYSPWFTLRFDFVDNICLGNARISGMNNIAMMCGVEARFGGRRPSYFPWHNNTSYW